MSISIPNLEWYLHQSKLKGITPRCPFASVFRCPRFYQSLSLLGRAGSTKIPVKVDKKLQKKWSKNKLWPVISEQATSISGPQNNYNHFTNFCPEVIFDRFGLFTTNLHKYADETDIELAHRNLERFKAPSNDWRWVWSYITSQHYTECPLYSLLLNLKPNMHEKPEDIINVKPNFYGIGIDINALFRKIRNWHLL